MQTPVHGRFASRQQGAALIVGLLILAVVMLIGVTGMSTTVLQERMTGSQRNESLSFTGAESALRGAEMFLWSSYGASDGNWSAVLDNVVTDGTGNISAFVTPRTWTATGGTAYSVIDYPALAATAGGSKLDRRPMYAIERLQQATQPLESHSGTSVDGRIWLYRITARSTGGDPRVVRTTESVYMVGR